MFLKTEEKQFRAQKQAGVGVIKKTAVGLAIAAASSATQAAGPDLTTITGAVDFSTTTAAILAVSALLMVPLVVKKAVKLVMGAIK